MRYRIKNANELNNLFKGQLDCPEALPLVYATRLLLWTGKTLEAQAGMS